MADADFWTVAPALIAAGSGLVGAFIGGALTRRNDQRKQRLDFAAKQLQQLYSPLRSIQLHIRSLSELRAKIDDTAFSEWGKLLDDATARGGRAENRRLHDERIEEYRALISHDNNQFRDTLHPYYRKMLDLFRENYWLAFPSTREHYPTLLNYVELWQRALDRSLPGEVIVALNVREEPLKPFYADLEAQFSRLQTMHVTAEPDPPTWWEGCP
jgi:hypothetical protein